VNRRTPWLLSGALLIWGSVANVFAQQATPRYTVVDLGFSLVRPITATPGLNNHGDIAIWHPVTANQMPGVIIHRQQSISIDGPKDFPLVYPADINDQMAVAGSVQEQVDLRFTHAFRWANGQMELLDALGGPYSIGLALNASGVVAGSAEAPDGARHAAFWRGKKPTDLGLLGHGDYSTARDINDQGDVVGEGNIKPNGAPHAFLWHEGKMQELSLLPGGTNCSAQALNNSGVIVGACESKTKLAHGVIWKDGSITDIGFLGEPDEAVCQPLDINSSETVVGVAEPEDGRLRAFIWQKGKLTDLNTLIDSHSGWRLLVAYRINDKGQILGRAYYKGYIHVFMLEPLSASK
jgi:probable HAF family extracellular repeat protein